MADQNTHLEIEVKFHLRDAQKVLACLSDLDGVVVHDTVFESNICLDDSRNRLFRSGRLLRLRRDGGCRLTFKSRPAGERTDYKVYKELEVIVDDCASMQAILSALGYRTVRIYEKWRRTVQWREVCLCFDTLPYGTFLEIEGPGPAIRHAAERLDLPWEERILKNYLAIFDILRERLSLPFSDVTFDHFRNHPVDLTPFLPTLRAMAP